MKYGRFEELPVWQTAINLADEVYQLTKDRFFVQPGDLCSQLRRAALSVSNNIAEGYERGSTAELLAFLYIARGSAGEVRSMLHFVAMRPEAADLRQQIAQARALAESCSRQIQKWANSMQNSDIQGQRHLTDASLRNYKRKQEREAFWQHLVEYNERNRREAEVKKQQAQQRSDE